MRNSIENYVRNCDLCKRRKGTREFVAVLGKVQEPTAPFQVTAMDITGPYITTPRGNKYILTFIDHFQNKFKRFQLRIKLPKHAHESTRLKLSHDTARERS